MFQESFSLPEFDEDAIEKALEAFDLQAAAPIKRFEETRLFPSKVGEVVTDEMSSQVQQNHIPDNQNNAQIEGSSWMKFYNKVKAKESPEDLGSNFQCILSENEVTHVAIIQCHIIAMFQCFYHIFVVTFLNFASKKNFLLNKQSWLYFGGQISVII
jgi:hypothetical protein